MLFTTVIIIPKGQMPKIKGAVCNVLINVAGVAKVLPRASDSNGIMIVKVNRKISFRGQAHFLIVRPQFIHAALQFVQVKKPFFITMEIYNEI